MLDEKKIYEIADRYGITVKKEKGLGGFRFSVLNTFEGDDVSEFIIKTLSQAQEIINTSFEYEIGEFDCFDYSVFDLRTVA